MINTAPQSRSCRVITFYHRFDGQQEKLVIPFLSREINSIRYQGNNNSGPGNDNSWCFLGNVAGSLRLVRAKAIVAWRWTTSLPRTFDDFQSSPEDEFVFAYRDKALRLRPFLHSRGLPFVACPRGASEIAVSSVVYRDVAIGHLLRSGMSWSISSGEIATPGTRTHRRGFMVGSQSQDTAKRPGGERERDKAARDRRARKTERPT